jgi:uncharacterized protein YxeA
MKSSKAILILVILVILGVIVGRVLIKKRRTENSSFLENTKICCQRRSC